MRRFRFCGDVKHSTYAFWYTRPPAPPHPKMGWSLLAPFTAGWLLMVRKPACRHRATFDCRKPRRPHRVAEHCSLSGWMVQRRPVVVVVEGSASRQPGPRSSNMCES
jgi:hypothetical protein